MSIILLKSLLSENEVFDKYKQGWLSPAGKLVWLDGEYHTEWAAKNILHVPWEKEKDASYVDTIMNEMYKRGWARMVLDIQGHSRSLFYDNPNDPYRVLNRSQKNALIDYGIEHELKVMNSNNRSDPIYEPPEMEKECTDGVSLPIIRKKFWAPKSGHETPMSKELVKEDPDEVWEDGDKIGQFTDKDAYTFIIDKKTGVGLYAESREIYHGTMARILAQVGKSKDIKDLKFDSELRGELKIDYDGSESDVLKFANDVASQHPFINARKIGISGRYWMDEKVVSFWNSKDEVLQNWKIVESFLKNFFRDIDAVKFDFAERSNNEPLYTTTDLHVNKGTKSPEEIKDLMARQHLDPNAKKELEKLGYISDRGSKKQHKRSSSAGYAHPAAFNFARSIVESPDEVWSKDKAVAYHNELDAYTFIIDRKTGAVFYASSSEEKKFDPVYHYNILDTISNTRNLEDRSALSIKSYLKKHGISFIASDSDILMIVKKSKSYEVEETSDARSIVMAGRFWKRKKIVSFWDSRKNTIKNWKIVEPFLTKIFGSIEKIRFDFVEKDSEDPLYTTQDLDKGKKKEKSPEEIKALMSRAHLDPNAKKELQSLGYTMEPGSMKYQKRAADAGFPHPAAYDASRPFQENRIIESPDGIFVKGKEVAEFDASDAYTFLIDKDTGITFYGKSQYVVHSDISSALKNFKDKEQSQPIKLYFKYWRIGFIGSESDIGKIKMEKYDFDYDDERSALSNISIAGRYWKRKKMVSFWNSKKDILKLKNWNITSQFLMKIFGDIKNLKFDFAEKADSRPLYTTRDLDVKGKVKSKEEIKSLMAKQHLDPKAKAKLQSLGYTVEPGSMKYQKQSTDAGFPHTAAYNASQPFREQKFIKLKSLIPKNN